MSFIVGDNEATMATDLINVTDPIIYYYKILPAKNNRSI